MSNKSKSEIIYGLIGIALGSLLFVFSFGSSQLFWYTHPFFQNIQKASNGKWEPRIFLLIFLICFGISILSIGLGLFNLKRNKDMRQHKYKPDICFIIGGLLGVIPFLGLVGGPIIWYGSKLYLTDTLHL